MDSWGDSIETQFTGNELAKAFDEFGELEGEMMDVIISTWKADPLRNHVSLRCEKLFSLFRMLFLFLYAS